jgi:PleD family two-component response regulator
MVERLGGSIDFETEEGRGTTFSISLPRHNAVSSADTVDQDPATSGSWILVCENDPDVVAVLRDVRPKAGMCAESVESARAAKAALMNLNYDLAIVDLHLPDMAGVDLIA